MLLLNGWRKPKCFWRNQELFAEPSSVSGADCRKSLILYITALEGFPWSSTCSREWRRQGECLTLSQVVGGCWKSVHIHGKHCLSLVFAVKKLRHYLLSHKVILISRIDPFKYLMTRPLLTGRLAKWALILMEFDITYTPQKVIKGHALADFLAAHPLPDDSPLSCDLLDEETLMIEGEKQC